MASRNGIAHGLRWVGDDDEFESLLVIGEVRGVGGLPDQPRAEQPDPDAIGHVRLGRWCPTCCKPWSVERSQGRHAPWRLTADDEIAREREAFQTADALFTLPRAPWNSTPF
jgi:hypothetical protein